VCLGWSRGASSEAPLDWPYSLRTREQRELFPVLQKRRRLQLRPEARAVRYLFCLRIPSIEAAHSQVASICDYSAYMFYRPSSGRTTTVQTCLHATATYPTRPRQFAPSPFDTPRRDTPVHPVATDQPSPNPAFVTCRTHSHQSFSIQCDHPCRAYSTLAQPI